jgi:uncharacterized protein (DUF433 family)
MKSPAKARGEMVDRIAVDSRIHFGKPCVAGTRITVRNVLELLDEGISIEKIVADYYPELTPDDVHACMRYAIALVSAEEYHLTAAEA